jgi:hypothetical protein
MKYTISKTEKRFQRNIVWQIWRFLVLSLKFMKLTRQV